MNKKVAVYTLGCKVNQYESAAIEELFKESGYETVDFDRPADVYVVNTCTVTHLGDRKSRQIIRRATRTNPEAVVVVTGCYAQTAPGEVLAIPGVDLVVGTKDRFRMVQLVAGYAKGQAPMNAVSDIMVSAEFEELPVPLEQGKTRAFLKIQEGCNNYCAYCIIPYARGPLRSRQPADVLAAATRLVAGGFKEIVLTGIHTGAYGQDLGQEVNLSRLVRELTHIPGLVRLRLGSVEPHDITSDLIDAVAAEPVLCPHFHVPLQSGDDIILKAMNRKYDTGKFAAIVEEIRSKIPEAAITTDVIVGFPGEGTENFQHSFNFIEQMHFSGMHVFKYSPRKGTPAAEFPNQVPPAEKEQRSERLISLGDQLARNYAEQFIGRTVGVLIEQACQTGTGLYEGHTDTYLKVVFEGQEFLRGQLVSVHLTGFTGNYLSGRII